MSKPFCKNKNCSAFAEPQVVAGIGCAKCGDPMTTAEAYDFHWNEEREHLEREVKIAVGNLSNYMGCNSFTLPTGLMKIKVLITSEQVDALLN